jgi:ribonuclease J
MIDSFKGIPSLKDGYFIYSLWSGYQSEPSSIALKDFFVTERNFTPVEIHTSGHADQETLKKFIKIMNPKLIVPIHTNSPKDYQLLTNIPIEVMTDGIPLNIT